ncbi:MAG: hypothetical protein HY234_06855 [Acidobacteria bacterium]|nr:hypothetical protein [Acidobacteriota bacterium]MBI3662752.1 hypothetical protein [Acidobacteriota bacterium]
MTQRFQLYLLLVLVTVLAGVTLYNWNRSPELVAVFGGDEKFEPLSVENPFLRLDKLERIRKLEYNGSRRSIFTAQLPPPPHPVVAKNDTPAAQLPEPPLTLPVKFFGYATDPNSGRKRAFFTNGEDVFILSEGETLQNRFRLLRIGNTSADFEEMQSGKRATLPLEQPGA